MWRLFNGISRVLRQQLYGSLRSSAIETHVDEEKHKGGRSQIPRHPSLVYKYHDSFFPKQYRTAGENSRSGQNAKKYNFESLFTDLPTTLEILGWGAMVVLGIHFSKRRWKLESGDQDPKYNLLYHTAYALPGTRHSGAKKDNKETGKEPHADPSGDIPEEEIGNNPLEDAVDEFHGICQKYVAMKKGLDGFFCADRGNYSSAVSHWKQAAELGHSKSNFNLALCYELGIGVNKNLAEAVKYYQLAAKDNHAQALYNLALLYLRGVSKNPEQAIGLLERAAHLGLRQAQTYLGVYYTDEEQQDMAKAVAMFEAAAKQKDPEAQFFLAMCYEQGWGVESNTCNAAQLYAQAAHSGHDGALYNLAAFYEYGLGGLPVDRGYARELYQRSAVAGNENAKISLQRIVAEEAVAEWKVKYGPGSGKKAADQPFSKRKISSQNFSEYIQQHVAELGVSFSNHITDEWDKPKHQVSQSGESYVDKLKVAFCIGVDSVSEQSVEDRLDDYIRQAPRCSQPDLHRLSSTVDFVVCS